VQRTSRHRWPTVTHTNRAVCSTSTTTPG